MLPLIIPFFRLACRIYRRGKPPPRSHSQTSFALAHYPLCGWLRPPQRPPARLTLRGPHYPSYTFTSHISNSRFLNKKCRTSLQNTWLLNYPRGSFFRYTEGTKTFYRKRSESVCSNAHAKRKQPACSYLRLLYKPHACNLYSRG